MKKLLAIFIISSILVAEIKAGDVSDCTDAMALFNSLTIGTQNSIRGTILDYLASQNPDFLGNLISLIGDYSTMPETYNTSDIEILTQLYVQTIVFGKPYIQCIIMNFSS
ncbi:unnamed protein product [Chironomus riparius]|uniref:Uncharacterized protein n=1 Tax=Chironomus riparius TaxID=315576 RepID=A0A9N9SA78_9DIPT|nr:unnamed protein product [Chironomus riparius]